MAGNLEPSRKSAKRSTTKTEKLTPEQALEILQQSLVECRRAGIECSSIPDFTVHGQEYAVILVANVMVVGGNLQFIGGKNAAN